jgi:hypothetical protein
MTTPCEIFDDLARLQAHLREFTQRYPEGTCLEELQRQCSPLVLHGVGYTSPDTAIGKMITACEHVLRTRAAYEKEAAHLAHEQAIWKERGSTFRAIDHVLPEDALCKVIEYFCVSDLDWLSQISTAFASAAHANKHFNWKLPSQDIYNKISPTVLAIRQYQFMLLHGQSSGGTCAAHACKRADPFPPFTPQDSISAAQAAQMPQE